MQSDSSYKFLSFRGEPRSSASVACDLQTSCDSLRDQVQSLRSIFERANDPEVARPAATPDSPEARAA